MSTSSATSRSCPICATPLEHVLHEGSELDRCNRGHGLWLDRGELRAVVASEDADRPQAEERTAYAAAVSDSGHAVVAESTREPRPCPNCGARMRIVEYAASGIPIDECNEHGVWLDTGELERIEAYAEAIRRQTSDGPPGVGNRAVYETTVIGIDIPTELLATIRSIAVPPPS